MPQSYYRYLAFWCRFRRGSFVSCSTLSRPGWQRTLRCFRWPLLLIWPSIVLPIFSAVSSLCPPQSLFAKPSACRPRTHWPLLPNSRFSAKFWVTLQEFREWEWSLRRCWESIRRLGLELQMFWGVWFHVFVFWVFLRVIWFGSTFLWCCPSPRWSPVEPIWVIVVMFLLGVRPRRCSSLGRVWSCWLCL